MFLPLYLSCDRYLHQISLNQPFIDHDKENHLTLALNPLDPTGFHTALKNCFVVSFFIFSLRCHEFIDQQLGMCHWVL